MRTSLPGEGLCGRRFAPMRVDDETPETWTRLGPDNDCDDDCVDDCVPWAGRFDGRKMPTGLGGWEAPTAPEAEGELPDAA